MRVLTVFGTRPEAIKLAPVVREFAQRAGVEHATCVTGQHRQMLDQVLSLFGIVPEYDLNIMKEGQNLEYVTSAVLNGMGPVIEAFQPTWLIVQGDTTTAFAAALAAFYKRVKVAHVEAGLRTGNIYSPWPEEMNRRLAGQLTTFHFPPTDLSAQNLRNEGVPADRMLVTGNTVIDALQFMSRRLVSESALSAQFGQQFSFLNPQKRMILVTGHRRENFDGGLARVCEVLADIARRGDVQIVYPVHLNPKVQSTARAALQDAPDVHLIGPLEYLPFIFLMQRAYLIVTDSGGIQEEAPGLGKPVLVTRDTTERPEAMAAGTARLVGTDPDKLRTAIHQLLDDTAAYTAMAHARNPFGDGQASRRIADRLAKET